MLSNSLMQTLSAEVINTYCDPSTYLQIFNFFLFCLAILVTGIGGNFILGVDYTILANDGSADKQRKSAEALGNGIKKLIKQVRRKSDLMQMYVPKSNR